MKAYKIHMGKAKCALDLGVGSERGEYVNQDYILQVLGRPHRGISLMYCYYPLDKGWPGRASEVHKSPDVKFAWDYPYDDYFTYKGGPDGNRDGEPFSHMRDIRRHGQDVTLTLTIDPNVSDEHLIAIAGDLRTFGRLWLRINHEATGNWFSFNKRCGYKEVADFFVRFSEIIHKYAPNVSTIICIGGIENPEKEEMEKEAEFAQTIPEADIWSVDKYMALHWGWPYDIAERGGKTHRRGGVRETFEMTKKSFERFRHLNGGVPKPMLMSEFNADGDVTGPYDQAEMIKEFCDMIAQDEALWFSGFTFYQFRDRGRLGLEIQDPNNPDVGIRQPCFDTYKDILHSEWFSPEMKTSEEAMLPITLRWGGAEDAEGICVPLKFEKNPHFCELFFDAGDNGNYMIEINGKWFYKSPEAKTIDLMSAFFEKPLCGETEMAIKIFAPPASGENDPSQGEGWDMNYYYTVEKLPEIRILYEPVEAGK